MKRLTIACAVLLMAQLCFGAAQAQAPGKGKGKNQAEEVRQWLSVRDVDLRIEPGSALDFSALVDPADSLREPLGLNDAGRLALARGKGERRRFLCAPMVFSGPHGGFPNHAEADELARQLRMHGYGLARLHLVDAALMDGRRKDFDYDPEQLDRFHYLLAALKKNGIRWMIDAATNWNAAYGDVKGRFQYGKHQFKLSVHYDEKDQAHWRKMVDTILKVRNPYTGTVILHDPALSVVTLVNELGINYGSNKGYPPELQKAFRDWRRARGDSDNDERDTDRKEVSSRAALMQRFVSETERKTAKWMSQYLRDQGYNGLITAYNNGKSIQATAARNATDVVSLHGYHDIADDHAREGSDQEGLSSIAVELAYVQYFGLNRYLDRGFIVDEYNHPYWNPWRHEAGMTVPAYASFQDWDAICRYSNPVETRYRLGGGGAKRDHAIGPLSVGLDPIQRAGETLAALLFARGDVAVARKRVPIATTDEFLQGPASAVNPLPESLGRLVLVTGVGMTPPGDRGGAGGIQADEDTSRRQRKWVGRALTSDKDGWRKNLRHLRSAGILSPDNRTDDKAEVYESDTGELFLDPKRKLMSVQTAKTEAYSFDDSALPPAGRQLKIEQADAPALVSVSALDDKALADSRRMLLIVATDAVNSGDVFSKGGKKLTKQGKLPAQLRPIKLSVLLRSNAAGGVQLHALSLTGRRTESLPVEVTPDGLRIRIDTSKLNSPTTYFELVR
jgi:hypothetical protein